MGIRISEMEEATTFGADDYVPIVTSGTNKKALGAKIKDFIAGFFVSKSGDSMSGNLTVEKSNGDFISKNPNVTINTTANNGVTSSQTEGFMIKDSANNDISRFISVQETTGDVIAQIAAFNKKTDGTETSNYINATIKKDGTRSYAIADPAAFRSAAGFGGEAGINGFFDWSTSSGVSVPTSTRTDIYQKTITETGVYLVEFTGNWNRKAGGSRVIMVAPNNRPTVNGGRRTSNTSFVGTEGNLDWFQEHIFFQTLTAGDILYFCAYQNSGSTITMYPIVNIIRIQ